MRRERIQTLELQEITQDYDGNKLFKGLSLKMPLGTTLVFEGDPGCGKSLLLKIIAGLVEPTHGEVFYNDKSLRNISFEEFAPIRTSTAICFDNGGLLMNKSLLENIKLPLLYNNQWRADRSNKLMDELVGHFEIKQFLNLRPASVSAGTRKLAGLIRAFLCNPQIIFLDEPSLGIGNKGAQALKYWLEKYRREGKHDELVVMACSDEDFIKSFDCERIELKDGQLAKRQKAA